MRLPQAVGLLSPFRCSVHQRVAEKNPDAMIIKHPTKLAFSKRFPVAHGELQLTKLAERLARTDVATGRIFNGDNVLFFLFHRILSVVC